MRRIALVLALPAAVALLGGCSLAAEPLAAAVAGAGTSAALGHSLNGLAYRTFTMPMAEVRGATLEALRAMGLRLESMEDTEEGQRIEASAERRWIYIDLEPISSRTTRVKVAAKDGGLFYDSSTATEIVLQTEKALFGDERASSLGSSRRVRR